MTEFTAGQRRELLQQGRALPPDPGRFPLRPGNGDDIANAARDVPRMPEGKRPEARAHIVKWAVHDGTTNHLPDTWHIEG